MRQVDEELWVVETPLRYFVEMGRRMTVVRLGGEALWVHSPAELTADVRAGLDALGQVRFLLPASTLHGHLFMEQYAAAYPDAQLFAVPGLRQKRPDLRFAADLDDRPDPRWAAEIDQVVFRGHRMLEEVVFLHRRTRSLIVGDTFFNVEPDAPLLLRLWAWGPRLRRSAGPTPLFRRAIRDRAAARRSVERILQWDFERIVTGHGAIVEGDGKETWRRAWSWV